MLHKLLKEEPQTAAITANMTSFDTVADDSVRSGLINLQRLGGTQPSWTFSFSAFTLMDVWQERHTTSKYLWHQSPKVLFWNKTKKTKETQVHLENSC